MRAGWTITTGSSEWKPLDRQNTIRLDFDYTGQEWPWAMSITGAVFYSTAKDSVDGADVKSTIWEGDLGIRKVWYRFRKLWPYVGGGAAFLSAKVTGGGESQSKSGFGPWAGGGIYYNLFESLNLGLDGRWSKVDLDFGDVKVDAGGWRAMAVIGYHWSDD